MFLVEPPRTQYDLNFRLLGIPVRVHPFFWLGTLLLGVRDPVPQHMIIWVGVVFVSILVHEMGHALAALYYGWPPRITLHGFGGLASYEPTHDDTRSRVLIAAAGPGAGFLLIALVMAIVHATGHKVVLDRTMPGSALPYWIFYSPTFASDNANELIEQLLFVNIFWGLINLLPIFPLDGGQIAQQLMVRNNPHAGLEQSLWLSVFTAGIAAVLLGVKFNDFLFVIFFGYLAYTSYDAIQQLRGRGGGYGPW